MTRSLRSAATRGIVPFAAVLSLLAVTAGPAAAKAPAHTTISAHLSASTVLVHAATTVTGTVTPAGGSLVLQRLEGKTWTTLAHAKAARTGAYVFSVRAPGTAASWSLKVVRAASSAAKAGTSATLHLHAVTKQFVVAAASSSTTTAPAATVVTGVIVPAAKGSVQLQRLVSRTWTVVATGRLGAGGTFSTGAVLPVGNQQLRVVKAFSSTVAAGTSAALVVTVLASAVSAPPAVTTAAVPAARVGVPYSIGLTASGGNGFYSWAGTALPAGLTLSPAGQLSGTPTSQGTSSFTVTVTDGAGHAASATLSLTTAAAAGGCSRRVTTATASWATAPRPTRSPSSRSSA